MICARATGRSLLHGVRCHIEGNMVKEMMLALCQDKGNGCIRVVTVFSSQKSYNPK